MKNGVSFRSGKFVRSDNAQGETLYRVESAFGDWDNKSQAERFYNFVGVEGMKTLKMDTEPDKKHCTGKITEIIKVPDGIHPRIHYNIKRAFTAIPEEENALDLYEWLQHGCLDMFKGIKQGKLE